MTKSVIFKTRSDARVEAKPEPPRAEPRRRKPLGLHPGADDPTSEARPASEAAFDEFTDPTVALVVEGNKLVIDLVKDTQRHFERKIAGLENQIAKPSSTRTRRSGSFWKTCELPSAASAELTAIEVRLAEGCAATACPRADRSARSARTERRAGAAALRMDG